jgi:hypothetical protein
MESRRKAVLVSSVQEEIDAGHVYGNPIHH